VGIRPDARPPDPAPSRSHHPPADSPYLDFDRAAWSALREATPLPLTDADLARLRGLGEPIDLREVEQVYLPLSAC
jgi:type I pantothenate kinase